MDEIDYQYYSPYKESLQNNFNNEIPLTNYRIVTNNIESIEKNSNIFYEDSINQDQPKNITNINKTHKFFTLSSHQSNTDNQKQNMQNYLQNFSNINNNINNEEEKDIMENSGENISLKENDNNEKSENNTDKYQIGRWTKEEHEKFIEGILAYGNEWKKVQKIIKTRSSTQARSHAQKYFLKLKKEINSDILSDPDKLLNYIINSSDKLKNNHEFTNDQKEKLMTVIRSNLKAEDNVSKSGKEGLSGEKDNFHININLNEKDESGFDNIYQEEEDNLAYNKKNNLFNFEKKMSFDANEIKKKNFFCAKKRKSSGDLSCASGYNKIFNITKEASHKNSLDIPKPNDIVQNSITSKNSAQKNKMNKKIKFSVKNNSNNFIINKNINTNNNTAKNNSINNNQQKENNFNNINNNNNHANFYIQNNYINIYNTFNSMDIKNSMNNCENLSNAYNNNNQFNPNFPNFNNDLKNTVSFINITKQCNQKEFDKNNINVILNNHNFFPTENNNKKTFQDINKNNENNEQNNPFNINFENFASNDMKKKEEYNGEMFELNHSLSELDNLNIYNKVN